MQTEYETWEDTDKPGEECGVFGIYDLDGKDVAAPGAGELRDRGQ